MSLKTLKGYSKAKTARTLLNSQNVILYDFYKAKKYLPGMVESLFYKVIMSVTALLKVHFAH